MVGKLKVEYVDPATLKPAEYNPRTIEPGALRRLARLLDEHGFVDPILARREDRLVVGGHQRLKANEMRTIPDTRVPVVFLDGLDDLRAKALNIALNNPAAQGQYDADRLADLLAELNAADMDVAGLSGFDDAGLAELLADELPVDLSDEELYIPEAYEVVTECDSEDQQRELYERLTAEGYNCRLLLL